MRASSQDFVNSRDLSRRLELSQCYRWYLRISSAGVWEGACDMVQAAAQIDSRPPPAAFPFKRFTRQDEHGGWCQKG